MEEKLPFCCTPFASVGYLFLKHVRVLLLSLKNSSYLKTATLKQVAHRPGYRGLPRCRRPALESEEVAEAHPQWSSASRGHSGQTRVGLLSRLEGHGGLGAESGGLLA